MILHPIEDSSQIAGCGYDALTQTLAIQFKTKGQPGSVYHYAGVPPEIHVGIMAAAADVEQSVGRFFGANIKGKFEYKKQEPQI